MVSAKTTRALSCLSVCCFNSATGSAAGPVPLLLLCFWCWFFGSALHPALLLLYCCRCCCCFDSAALQQLSRAAVEQQQQGSKAAGKVNWLVHGYQTCQLLRCYSRTLLAPAPTAAAGAAAASLQRRSLRRQLLRLVVMLDRVLAGLTLH